MKYQVILESDEQADDQQFKLAMETLFKAALPHWRVVDARSLEGIRQEVWDPHADLM